MDGDDEHDSVVNTGLVSGRINFLSLAGRILRLPEEPLTGGIPSEPDQGGQQRVFAAAPGQYTVLLSAGVHRHNWLFGNFRPGEIRGTVFEDLDGDRVREAGEPGLTQRRLFLDLNGNGLKDEGEPGTTTDAEGRHCSPQVKPGTYRVLRELPSGWLQTTRFLRSACGAARSWSRIPEAGIGFLPEVQEETGHRMSS